MRFSDSEELASNLSDMLDLGVRPAAVLREALESQLGVLVWYLETGSESSAACSRGDFGSAILVPRANAPWRRNFDIAHEMFHLLTWEASSHLSQDGDLAKRTERLANCFAAALLLPRKPLLQDFNDRLIEGAISVGDLIRVARDYGVSTEALLWRLLNLGRFGSAEQVRGLLEDPTLRELDRRSKEGMWNEPPRLPRRFVTLAYRAMLRGRLSRAVLAEYLGCGLSDLAAALAEFGVLDYLQSADGEELPSTTEAADGQERCDDPESSPLCFA
jgi:Zn-dependent peptidase ImmA (M78 family)